MQERVTTVAGADNSRHSYSVSALAAFVDVCLLLLIGFLGVSDGLRIILTKTDTVGGAAAGGWIVLLGGLLIVGTYKLYIQQLRSTREDALTSDTRAQLWLPMTVISMLFIYIVSIDWLGYALSTVLFMATYLRLVGKYSIFTVVVISVAFAFGSDWLWTRLDMMLPRGSLPWS